MSDVNDIQKQELTQDQAADAALESFGQDDEPEETSGAVEADTDAQADVDAEAPAQESEPADYLELTDDDLASKVKRGDIEATFADLIEAWQNRTMPDVIAQEQAKIKAERESLQKKIESLDFVDDLEMEHKALTKYLGGRVKAGKLNPAVYNYVAEAFQRAIEEGHYDPAGREREYGEVKAKREYEQREAELKQRQMDLEVKAEILQVGAKHGRPVTNDELGVMVKHIEAVRLQTGKIISLDQAYDQLKAGGKIRATVAAPVSKGKLADRMRGKSAKATKTPDKVSPNEALDALMASL